MGLEPKVIGRLSPEGVTDSGCALETVRTHRYSAMARVVSAWLSAAVLLQMSNITVTYRDGRVAQLEQVYIRGSKIRFLILPDMLKNAPMLKSMKNKNQGSGAGRGKAAILKAQGRCSRHWSLRAGLLSFRKGPCYPTPAISTHRYPFTRTLGPTCEG